MANCITAVGGDKSPPIDTFIQYNEIHCNYIPEHQEDKQTNTITSNSNFNQHTLEQLLL